MYRHLQNPTVQNICRFLTCKEFTLFAPKNLPFQWKKGAFGEFYAWSTQAFNEAHFQGKPKCCSTVDVFFNRSGICESWQWKKIWKRDEKSQIIQELNCGSRDISWGIQTTCFVCAVLFAMVCCLNKSLWWFNRLTPFLCLPFLGRKNASRDSWWSPSLLEKTHVHTELHPGLCLWFDNFQKRFPHQGIYTIRNCSPLR